MMLSGNLNNWSVTDLLQIMRVTAKTAALRIEGTRAGVIHFNEGKIAGASLAGQRPPSSSEGARQSAVDALFVLTSPSEGSFFVATPEVDPKAPAWEVAEIMAEVEHLRLIEGEVLRHGIEENTALALTADVPSPVTLHAEDWATLVSLVPAFSLASLERSLGRTRALQVINTLLARGLTVRGTMVEVDLVPPPPILNASPEQGLDWLGDHPAAGGVDLSTEITGGRPDEHVEGAVDSDSKRSAKGVVASPDTTLVSGVLDDMRRLRTTNG